MKHGGVDLFYLRLPHEPAALPQGYKRWFVPSDLIPVLAAGKGIVVRVGKTSLGHNVIIDHGNGYHTFYQHLTAQGLPAKSTPVTAGTPIGIVGHGQEYKLNHLHFEIWKGWQPGQKPDRKDPGLILRAPAGVPGASVSGTVPSQSTATPGPTADALRRGQWADAIRIAIQNGERDENRLSNMVFHARHPELQGRKIRADERQFAQEWLSIRDSLVRPALRPSSAGHSSPPALAKPAWVRTLVPLLNKYRGDIPLDYLLGWIAVESNGQIGSTTSLNERGYFQLHPDESKTLRIDHNRLGQDPDYSVQAGLQVVKYYGNRTKGLGINYGTDLFWHVTKLWHWLPTGIRAIMDDMQRQGFKPSTWEEFKKYVLEDQQRLERIIGSIKSRTKRRDLPPKWHPKVGIDFVDKLYRRGRELAAGLANP